MTPDIRIDGRLVVPRWQRMTRKEAGQQGGLTTVGRYGIGYMRLIGQAGGIATAAMRARIKHRSGLQTEACL